MKHVSPPKCIPPQFPSLPVGSPARPRNKQNHREDKTRSVISQMLMDSRLFSPLPPLLCTLLPPLSAQHHQFVNPPPHHYPVMTLPFQFIPALSLPLPWPSYWNSRKRATSPPLLPSRSVSRRQHAVIPPPPRLSASHWMPAAQLATLTGLFLPPKCSCLFPLVFLRFSRRCGSRRGRRPGRSSWRKIWASLATPHSCTASARRWWTRIRMR